MFSSDEYGEDPAKLAPEQTLSEAMDDSFFMEDQSRAKELEHAGDHFMTHRESKPKQAPDYKMKSKHYHSHKR